MKADIILLCFSLGSLEAHPCALKDTVPRQGAEEVTCWSFSIRWKSSMRMGPARQCSTALDVNLYCDSS